MSENNCLFAIKADYNSSFDFSMVDRKGNKISPQSLSIIVENGKLSKVEFNTVDGSVLKQIKVPSSKIEVYFNYKDTYVLNHKSTSEFSSDLGTPRLFVVGVHFPPRGEEEEIVLTIDL